MPVVRRTGDDPGAVPADGRAGGPMPVRPVLGGGRPVPPAARGQAGRRRELAGEGGGDLLGRPDGRPPVGVGRRGFPTGGSGRGHRRAPRPRPRTPAVWLGPRPMNCTSRAYRTVTYWPRLSGHLSYATSAAN